MPPPDLVKILQDDDARAEFAKELAMQCGLSPNEGDLVANYLQTKLAEDKRADQVVIKTQVVRLRGSSARIGTDAPDFVRVVRDELEVQPDAPVSDKQEKEEQS